MLQKQHGVKLGSLAGIKSVIANCCSTNWVYLHHCMHLPSPQITSLYPECVDLIFEDKWDTYVENSFSSTTKYDGCFEEKALVHSCHCLHLWVDLSAISMEHDVSLEEQLTNYDYQTWNSGRHFLKNENDCACFYLKEHNWQYLLPVIKVWALQKQNFELYSSMRMMATQCLRYFDISDKNM